MLYYSIAMPLYVFMSKIWLFCVLSSYATGCSMLSYMLFCFSLCFLLTSGFVTTCMYNHFCFISKNLKNVIHLHVIVLSAMMFLFLFIFLWFTLMLKCSFAFCICWDIEIFGFIIRFVHVGTFVKYNCSFFIKL